MTSILSFLSFDSRSGKVLAFSFVAGLLIALGVVHIIVFPWVNRRINMAMSEGRNWCNYRINDSLKDGLESLWTQQVYSLLDAEQVHLKLPIEEAGLKQLVELPGVQDAFYLNFLDQRYLSVFGIIPDSILMANFNKLGAERGEGRHYLARRAIGGLAKFRSVKVDDRDYTLMIRYVGTYYSNQATEIIGMVLDREWYFEKIPSALDSIAQNDWGLLWFASCPPDTFWGDINDPYAAPNGAWKQTIGVLNGKDTLWWYGDRTMDMEYTALPGGYRKWGYRGMDNFGNLYKIKSEFPKFQKEILDGRTKIIIFLYLLEVLAVVIILSLMYAVYQSNKQVKRNNLSLAHLAHSIKTPIARMRLNTDTLTEERVSSPGEENEVITAIGRECGRLERAVQNASLSLERGKRTFNPEECDLVQIVQETSVAWQSGFDRVGITLSIEMPDNPLNANVDREMIAVAIDNLLDNALRHTSLNRENLSDVEAKVTVNLGQDGDKAVISVDDMGGGIPKSDREQIFKPFTRAKSAVGTGVSGLGLGLALVKEIAVGHGGKVLIEDKDAGGSRFVIILPLK